MGAGAAAGGAAGEARASAGGAGGGGPPRAAKRQRSGEVGEDAAMAEAGASIPPSDCDGGVLGRGSSSEPSDAGLKQAQARARAAQQPPAMVQAVPAMMPGSRLDQGRLKSVLKLFVVRAEPNYAQPWQVRPQRSSTGSGFVIRDLNNELSVITNAHVVNHATTVHVRRPGNPKKFPGVVRCIGHQVDLALLSVDDADFWEGLEPLEFSEIPQLQDTVVACGYPRGGDSISVTKGVVSRIDMRRYCSGGNRLLCVQIDAAINPGNSGGPAFGRDLSVVGVAFCKLQESDNIGYIIPFDIVRNFLREFKEHGVFRGVSAVGFMCQEMENEALRAYHGMTKGQSGTLIYRVDPISPAAEVLREEDVMLECEGVPVADDGTITFRNEERVDFAHLFRSRFIGDDITLKVLRNKQIMTLSYKLQRFNPLVPAVHSTEVEQGGSFPSYFVVGGLVFVPLSVPFLEQAYGNSWKRNSPVAVQALLPEYKEYAEQQPVVLFQILSAQINYGYRFQTVRLTKFNDVEIKNLQHLAELVDTCETEWLEFRLDGLAGGRQIVLEKEKARREGAEILKRYAIAKDRSDDIKRGAGVAENGERAEAAPNARASEALAA